MSTPSRDRYIGRFAPSPTGPLHFGSLVAALASYLDAKAYGGAWLVRVEDVDETRCRPEFADDILRTLRAYGMQWDGEVMVQSQRKPAYQQALARLFNDSYAYHCRCSRKEIADSVIETVRGIEGTEGIRGIQGIQGIQGIDGVVYPGTCRPPQDGRFNVRQNANDNHDAMRVLTTNTPITFSDRLQGTSTQHLARDTGDFVVRRRDGLFAYQLAVVVDDAEQGVTDIVRGVDLIDSTARQIYLQQLLGFPTPRYLHIPVVTNQAGQKLSKQTLAPALSFSTLPVAQGAQSTINQTLIQALALLGQPTETMAPTDPTATLLQLAASRWQADKIPAVRKIALG